MRTTRPPHPNAPKPHPVCGKIRFATEHEARVELVGTIVAFNRGKHQRRERRVYHCRACSGWHLTSKPFDPYGVNR